MTEVLKDVHVEFGSVDLSDHFKSISIPASAATQTSTAFGDEWEDMEPGLKSYTVSLDFNQDFSAGGLDSILWPLFGTKITWSGRPHDAAVGPANPQYSGSGIFNAYPILGNAVGELAEGAITLMGAGVLARAIT